MIGLVKELLKNRKDRKLKEGLLHECSDCGAKDGFVLKPTTMIIQYSHCGHCGRVRGFMVKKNRAHIRLN